MKQPAHDAHAFLEPEQMRLARVESHAALREVARLDEHGDGFDTIRAVEEELAVLIARRHRVHPSGSSFGKSTVVTWVAPRSVSASKRASTKVLELTLGSGNRREVMVLLLQDGIVARCAADGFKGQGIRSPKTTGLIKDDVCPVKRP